MSPRGLSWPKRAYARGLTAMFRLAYGEATVEVQRAMLGTMGWRGLFRFVGDSARHIQMLNMRYGEMDAQFLLGLAGLWNGCGYCGYGHVLTGALMMFRNERQVHPLSPRVMAELMEQPGDAVVQRLHALLHQERYERLRTLGGRMYALHCERITPQTTDDHVLEATLRLWDTLAECTIVVGLTLTPEDAFCPAHGIGRDKELIARYRAAVGEELVSD